LVEYERTIFDREVYRLIVSATDDEAINEAVSAEATQRNIPVNVVDSPDLCTVITPAIVDRSPLIIGVDSGGEVYLVGAGPGDPDLLTFKALRLMQRADPFIFGRGAEEIELLAEHNVPFQVVPGITAASGCASYAGIPLTHRDFSQSVRFITGHVKDGVLDFRWQEFVEDSQTLVFYMGLTGLPQICERLIEHGKDPETPAALIERGTRPDQRIHVGCLHNLVEIVNKHKIHPPTLLVIGGVVSLQSELQWFKPND